METEYEPYGNRVLKTTTDRWERKRVINDMVKELIPSKQLAEKHRRENRRKNRAARKKAKREAYELESDG
jgi:hypothetical protein